MRIKTMFVCGFLGIGALTFLGSSVLQTPVAPGLSGEFSSLSGGAFLQSATGSIAPAAQRTLTAFTANIKSMTDSGSSFLSRNGAGVELRLRIMAGNASARLAASGWLPKSALSWLQGNTQVASQASSAKPKNLARRPAAMNAALRSPARHAGSPRPPTNSPAGF